MASTYSTNLQLQLQGTGDNSGTWGTVLNNNALNIIDQAMGGVQNISLSNANITITTAQSQNNAFKLTGTLTANVQLIFPAIGRTYFMNNATSGAFTVTLVAGTGNTPSVIPQGASGYYTLNINDVMAPTLPGILTGAIMVLHGPTPAGWHECDGSAISRTTYAALFALIGTTYGSGDGSTTFNIPDLRGQFIRGWDHGAGIDPGRVLGSNQTSANLSHTHTFTGDQLPTHTHIIPISGTDTPDILPAGGNTPQINSASTNPVSAGTPTGTISATGGSESRPVNVAMIFFIRLI